MAPFSLYLLLLRLSDWPFLWRVKVLYFMSLLCASLLAVDPAGTQEGMCGVGQGGDTQWIIQALALLYLDVQAFLQSALTHITVDDVLKCVCVSRCQKVHTCLIAIFQFLLKTLAYPFSLIIVFVAFLYLIPPQCFHQWSHGIINLKHHYMALPRCTSNIKDLPDLTVKHLWAYLKFLKPLIME